jgi:hypothetical protein
MGDKKKGCNLRSERDELNNLIEQRTKYLNIPQEKMEEVCFEFKF